MDVQRVARLTLLRLCAIYLSTSMVASVHVIKTLAILIAQGACLIQALASGTFAIILEAYKPVGRWALITTFSFVHANPFHARRTAATSGCINRRILSYDCTILELFPVRVNTYRVVLLTGKNVVVALVLYPRDVVWIRII